MIISKELEEENHDDDYDYHYCEEHLSYYCPYVDNCNPSKMCFPALKECKAYLRNDNEKDL